ncbi:MAG: hypothetical protein Q8Q33_09090 [Chlamydiota bacterium]|nr:hypothetical protein [Chlamydiota bacterium]
MIYKISKEQLIKHGLIKKCPVDFVSVHHLLVRAHMDVQTAKRNISVDDDCAYTYAYNAMLRCGLALMFCEGYRPEIRDKHLTIVKFTGLLLGSEFEDLISHYDFMRKKRNQFLYEPDIPCSTTEAAKAIEAAEKFVEKVTNIIRDQHPEQKFDV